MNKTQMRKSSTGLTNTKYKSLVLSKGLITRKIQVYDLISHHFILEV